MKKSRKRPVYNRLRQLDWMMWRMMSEQRCCFCAKLLFDGYDSKKCNITVHHLEGNVHTDDRSKAAPIEKQLFAHSSCHRAFHHMERMKADGKNVDKERFTTMQQNVKREVARIKVSKKFYKTTTI